MNKRIYLFFVFLKMCIRYPTTIGENWNDMNTRYFLETDPETQILMDKIKRLN